MKLYVTYTSPYARLARIVVIDKALEEKFVVRSAARQGEPSPLSDRV